MWITHDRDQFFAGLKFFDQAAVVIKMASPDFGQYASMRIIEYPSQEINDAFILFHKKMCIRDRCISACRLCALSGQY